MPLQVLWNEGKNKIQKLISVKLSFNELKSDDKQKHAKVNKQVVTIGGIV
jgi:hypothetical protein